MTGKEMTKEEIQQAVEVFKPNFDIEKPIQELMNGHYLLCGYAYNVSRELMKYKRAFDILKEKFEPVFYEKDLYLNMQYGGRYLSQEEYELLEELMNNEI